MNCYHVDITARDHKRSVEDCCYAVMCHWIYDIHGVYAYPRTRKGMWNLLNDMKLLFQVAKKLQQILSS